MNDNFDDLVNNFLNGGNKNKQFNTDGLPDEIIKLMKILSQIGNVESTKVDDDGVTRVKIVIPEGADYIDLNSNTYNPNEDVDALKMQLEMYVNGEDYEMAAEIRDKISEIENEMKK